MPPIAVKDNNPDKIGPRHNTLSRLNRKTNDAMKSATLRQRASVYITIGRATVLATTSVGALNESAGLTLLIKTEPLMTLNIDMLSSKRSRKNLHSAIGSASVREGGLARPREQST